MLNSEYFRSIAIYDSESGVFSWRITKGSNAAAGRVFGGSHPDGYMQVKIDGKNYLLHRLAFLYVTGKFPDHDVDHINHDRKDNRWVNLREVTRKENSMNTRLAKNNKTKIHGVSWDKKDKKWRSTIGRNYKTIYLGLYSDFFEACCARKREEIKYNYHHNHGK